MHRNRSRAVAGFSLLEVILATAVIASSSMVLLRLVSTGQQHQRRGERKAIGQMICQSLIDEMTIDSRLLQGVEDQRVKDYPTWTFSTKLESTEFPGIVRVQIRAAETPIELERTENDGRFDFELVRWLRSEQDEDDDEQTWEERQ
jgi:type II secretory pathway pseudopilin PulG